MHCAPNVCMETDPNLQACSMDFRHLVDSKPESYVAALQPPRTKRYQCLVVHSHMLAFELGQDRTRLVTRMLMRQVMEHAPRIFIQHFTNPCRQLNMLSALLQASITLR